jgi:SSS family transporter
MLVGVGVFFYLRGMEDAQDYFLAGKGAGWYLVGASFYATAIGGAGSIGLTSATFGDQSISAFWSYGVTMFSAFLVALLLGHKLPKTQNITLPEMLEDRYDEKTRIMAVPFYLLRYFTTLGVQWFGAGAIVSYLAGGALSVEQAALFSAIIITLYTVLGGMSAVMWTDLIQATVLFFGLWILAIFAINDFGGVSAMTSQVSAQAPQAFDLFALDKTLMAGYIVTLLPTLLVRQGYLQRIMSARSSRDGFIGTMMGGVIGVVYISIPLLLGVIAITRYPNIQNADLIIPQLAADTLPAVLAGLVLAALAASVMSTADSFLLAGASNITEDIYIRYLNPDATDRRQTIVSRIATVFLAFSGFGLGLLIPSLVDLIVFGVLALTGGVLVPWLAAFYWPRGTADAAFWSLAVGGISTVLWWIAGFLQNTLEFMGIHPVFIGLPLSIILYFGISYSQEPEYERALEAAKKHDIDSLEAQSRQALQDQGRSDPAQTDD